MNSWEEDRHDFFNTEKKRVITEIPEEDAEEFETILDEHAKDLDAVVHSILNIYCNALEESPEEHSKILIEMKEAGKE